MMIEPKINIYRQNSLHTNFFIFIIIRMWNFHKWRIYITIRFLSTKKNSFYWRPQVIWRTNTVPEFNNELTSSKWKPFTFHNRQQKKTEERKRFLNEKWIQWSDNYIRDCKKKHTGHCKLQIRAKKLKQKAKSHTHQRRRRRLMIISTDKVGRYCTNLVMIMIHSF